MIKYKELYNVDILSAFPVLPMKQHVTESRQTGLKPCILSCIVAWFEERIGQLLGKELSSNFY